MTHTWLRSVIYYPLTNKRKGYIIKKTTLKNLPGICNPQQLRPSPWSICQLWGCSRHHAVNGEIRKDVFACFLLQLCVYRSRTTAGLPPLRRLKVASVGKKSGFCRSGTASPSVGILVLLLFPFDRGRSLTTPSSRRESARQVVSLWEPELRRLVSGRQSCAYVFFLGSLPWSPSLFWSSKSVSSSGLLGCLHERHNM